MKKELLLVLALAGSLVVRAQTPVGPVTLKAYAEYSYNYTYGHFANFDVLTRVPLNPYFELDAGVQASTANIYTVSADLRPKFPVPVGEMYLDTRLLYKAVVRDRMHDFAASLGLGYRMDYVDVHVGLFTRLMSDFNRDWHSEDEMVTEPLGVIYNVEVFVRPQSSPWNLSMRIANYDDFQIERIWQPLFMLGGRYNPTERLSVLLEAQCKPTGMFHLNASFYGATLRAGVAYNF